jgi:uncharacterized membrane protein
MKQAERRFASLVSYLAHPSTLKIEATCSSETSVDFQWTAWHYISEGGTLQIPSGLRIMHALLFGVLS